MKHFIPAMNRMMYNKLVCIWTTLAEGPLERAESQYSNRVVKKLYLPALTPTDSRAILADNDRNMSQLEKLSESLFLCWNDPSERVLVDRNDVLAVLSEAAGGLPRGGVR